MATYAIVQTGGKQYRVEPGDTIRVESLPGDDGDTVDLDDVLLVSQDGVVSVGTPTVPGAKVTAELVGRGRGKKIVVFKYKPKTRYRRKNGHRQSYTELKVTDILLQKPKRRSKGNGTQKGRR